MIQYCDTNGRSASAGSYVRKEYSFAVSFGCSNSFGGGALGSVPALFCKFCWVRCAIVCFIMASTNYYDTFIAVAEDCPVAAGEVPPVKDPKSIAQIEFEMLTDNPYVYTSDDVIFAANGARRGLTREEYFIKGQPCFRSSPLTKRYGWGVHSNGEGKIALCAVGSDAYNQFLTDWSLKQLKAMRSKRA